MSFMNDATAGLESSFGVVMNHSDIHTVHTDCSHTRVTAASVPQVASLDNHTPWVQLAGHSGTFTTVGDGTVLKAFNQGEYEALEKLMKDPLKEFVPQFVGVRTREAGDPKYMQMEDLLWHFTSPEVMDCKVGVRTYLEEELVKCRKSQELRQDMYEKMVSIDPHEPTAEEHQQRAVSKARYMQFRERLSSSHAFAFRIDGLKTQEITSSDTNHHLRKAATEEALSNILRTFTRSNPIILDGYIARLQNMQEALKISPFFWSHEMIGSSLLLVHEHETGRSNVWMIDFGKTRPLPPGLSIDHVSSWCEGNHEDGYLLGLTNILRILTTIRQSVQNHATCNHGTKPSTHISESVRTVHNVPQSSHSTVAANPHLRDTDGQ